MEPTLPSAPGHERSHPTVESRHFKKIWVQDPLKEDGRGLTCWDETRFLPEACLMRLLTVVRASLSETAEIEESQLLNPSPSLPCRSKILAQL